MSEIEELEQKIQQLKLQKLLTIEYLTEQLKRVLEETAKIRGQIQGVRTLIMNSTDKDEVHKYEVLLKSYGMELEALTSNKSVYTQLRNLIRNVQKEEERLEYLKTEEEAELE